VKKPVKIALVVILALVVVVTVVALLIPRMVDMTWVRDLMAEQARSALGREVKLGEVQLRLIPSIRIYLAGLEVAEAPEFGTEPFVTMDRLYATVKLMPLLRKQVVIDQIVLEEPTISIVRAEDGTFSFAGLVKGEPEKAEGAEVQPKERPGAAPSTKVTLAGLQVRGGSLTFLDKQTSPDTTLRVGSLTAKIRDLSPSTPVTFDVSADALGGTVSARGSVRPTPPLENMRADIDATLDGLNLSQLKPYVKQFQSDNVSGDFTVSLSDEEQTARWSGNVSLTNYVVSVPGRPAASVKGTAFSIDGSASARYDAQEASFDGNVQAQGLDIAGLASAVSKAAVNSVEFEGKGSLTAGSRTIRAQGKATVSDLNAKAGDPGKEWDIAAEKVFFDMSADYASGEKETTGKATATVRIDKPSARGPAGEAYELTALQLENLAATLRENRLSFKLASMALGETVFAGSGVIDLPKQDAGSAESGKLGYDVAFDSSKVVLHQLAAVVPALATYKPSGELAVSATATGRAGGSLSAVTCKVQLKQVGLSHPKIGVPIQGAVGTADVSLFSEKEYAKVTGLTFSLGGSRCEVEADLDRVRIPRGTFKVTLDSLDVEQLMPKKPAAAKTGAQPTQRPARPARSSESPLKEARLAGEITLGEGKYKTVTFGNAAVSVGLRDGAVVVDQLRSDLCGGKLNGSVKVSSAFQKPAVSGAMAVQAIDIEPLLALSERAKGIVEGAVSGTFTLNVPDLNSDQLLKTMKLDGSVEMPRGQFTGFDLARKLADISRLSGVAEVGPENTVFRDLAAEFALAGGTATVSTLRMALEHFDVRGAGTYSLDKSLNMRAQAILSEELSAKNRGSDVQTFFENKDRRIVVPFIATGTVPQIKVTLDAKRVSERALEKGKERLKEELLEEVVGKKKPGEKEKPEEKILRDVGGALLDRILER